MLYELGDVKFFQDISIITSNSISVIHEHDNTKSAERKIEKKVRKKYIY